MGGSCESCCGSSPERRPRIDASSKSLKNSRKKTEFNSEYGQEAAAIYQTK